MNCFNELRWRPQSLSELTPFILFNLELNHLGLKASIHFRIFDLLLKSIIFYLWRPAGQINVIVVMSLCSSGFYFFVIILRNTIIKIEYLKISNIQLTHFGLKAISYIFYELEE